jgi:uncharacterized protein
MLVARAAAAAAIVFVTSGAWSAQAYAAWEPTITVNGNGTATGTPDELQLSMEVDTQAPSVSTALDTANLDMSRVQAALQKAGVPVSALQTSGLSIQPQYNQNATITGYGVSESLSVELHDLATAGLAITSAVEAGGNAARVDSVQLDLTDQNTTLLATARADAIGDARAEAEQYARAAGVKLGPIVSVTDTSSTEPPGRTYPSPLFADGVAAAAVPISAGTQQVTASVVVVWQLGA